MCEELQESNIDEVIAEENYLLNETNETVLLEDNNVYNVCRNINTMLNLLNFVIIVIFLYKFLKNTFSIKRG